MKSAVRRIGRTMKFKGYCFDVFTDDVKWVNGMRLKRDIIIHPGVSVMLPLPDPNHIILVSQHRYGVGRALWELPAGTIDGDESPLNCAKREIVEEIGYKAQKWEKLATAFSSPGYNSEKIYCYVASNLVKCQSKPDADEILKIKAFSIAQVRDMMHTNKIQDAKSLVALLYFFKGSK